MSQEKSKETTDKKSPLVLLAAAAGVKCPSKGGIESFLLTDEDDIKDFQLKFLDTMEAEAERILADIEFTNERILAQLELKEAKQQAKKHAKEIGEEYIDEDGDEEPVEPYSCDATFFVSLMKSDTVAFGMLFPPIKGGRKLDMPDIGAIIKNKGIVYGLNNESIRNIVNEEKYFKLFIIARGALAQDGVDGRVEERFPRTNEVHFVSDETDKVNYKNLGIIHKVKAGDVVCRYFPPVPAYDGMSVRGDVLRGKEGKDPPVPTGSNIELRAETGEYVAMVDGHVSFVGGKFNIFNVYDVPGDVDNKTGNIDMNGDVVVKGSVLEGFEINATGNVTIYGILEGAKVVAGGSIHLKHGMNGNLKGQLVAGQDIEAKYLENCGVYAKGNVTAGSIVNCRVNAENVSVQGKPGAIIGGDICVFKEINARIIGNETRQITKLSVGTDIEIVETINTLKADIKSLTRSVEETEKNVKYLEKSEKELNEEYRNLLKTLRYRVSAEKIRLAKSQSELKKIMAEQNAASCTIIADKIYPVTKVEINDAMLVIDDITYNSRIMKIDGEVQIMTK